MAYTIISQNNSTTTLSDGVNTITVPSRVNLTSGNFTIVEVNNNMATLEDGDGNVYRDIPCVATLAGGGSSLPDQAGHSGEFLTTDGTDASWAAVDSLPDQTGHSGEFLTTDGTDASWGDALKNNATGTGTLVVGGAAQDSSRTYGTAIGIGANCGSNGATAIGYDATASAGGYGLAVGAGAIAYSTSCQINFSNTAHTNSDTGTVKIGNSNGNYEIMSGDGTIPTDRFTTTPSADGTYVPTLTISSGTPTRSWAAPSGGLPSQTGNSGKFLTTDGTDASWAAINALQNTATGSNSLTVLGTIATAQNATNIGINSVATDQGDTAVGTGATATGNGEYSTAVGHNSKGTGRRSVCVGGGCWSTGDSSVSVGAGARATKAYSINIGFNTHADATHAIQLGGTGSSSTTNSDANTFKVANANGNFEMMSADGTIPTARLTKVNSTITLAAADWSSNTQTVNVTGMTATGVVFVGPDPTDQSAYTSAGILCTAQGAGTLTFTCSTTPTNAITVNVVAL